MITKSYERQTFMEKMETALGEVTGPAYLVDMVRDARKPEPLGEEWPMVGGLPSFRAPLVYVDPDGETWYMGIRPLSMCTFSRCHRRNGWASVRSKRRRFWEGEIKHAGERIRVWICDESVGVSVGRNGGDFRLPFRLECFEDTLAWSKAGIDLSKGAQTWLRKLSWNGEGAMQAVEAARNRFQRLASSRGNKPLPWPEHLVKRIVSPDAGETLARSLTWPDVAEKLAAFESQLAGLKDTVDAMGKRLEAMAKDRTVERLRGDLAQVAGKVDALAALV